MMPDQVVLACICLFEIGMRTGLLPSLSRSLRLLQPYLLPPASFFVFASLCRSLGNINGVQIPLLSITVDIHVHVLQLDFNDLSLPKVKSADVQVSLCAHDFLFQIMSKPPVIVTKDGMLNKEDILIDMCTEFKQAICRLCSNADRFSSLFSSKHAGFDTSSAGASCTCKHAV